MKKKYDCIIIGAGPSGIFAAYKLVENRNLKILLIDRGKDISQRLKQRMSENSLLSGWGGAGAFSDGKLTLSSDIGGFLTSYCSEEMVLNYINTVDEIYLKFGAPRELYGTNMDDLLRLQNNASKYFLKLIPSKIRHLGTDKCRTILKSFERYLRKKIELKFEAEAKELITDKGKIKGVRLKSREFIEAEFVIVAPGRAGSVWLAEESERIGLPTFQNPVDIGVRVEVPSSVMKEITDIAYESKFIFYSKHFDDRIRTFCMNPYGKVVKEFSNGLTTVNGHSYRNRKTNNTNFAILVSTIFTKPFNEPIFYGSYIASLANFLVDGVIVQRLGDLKAGRRSTLERINRGVVEPTLKDAVPGDLSFVLPYRYLTDIIEMLEAMDNLAPGVNSRHTLLYGVEVKFYSLRQKLSNCLESQIKNLFVIGDGAGVSRGLIQASASGLITGTEILKRVS